MPANHCFLSLFGSSALSNFRQQRLLESFATRGIHLEKIEAQFVHFVWSDQTLSDAELVSLRALLNYGESFTFVEEKGFLNKKYLGKAVTAPRVGTISPWSSKATDIAHHCGLNVLRIERGIQFYWTSHQPLSNDQLRDLRLCYSSTKSANACTYTELDNRRHASYDSASPKAGFE